MNNQPARRDYETLTREVARLEQIVAEKKFDEARSQSDAERASNLKQTI